MQTIAIEFGKKPVEITRLFEKKKIKKGDRILVQTEKDLSVESILMYLLMIALSLAYVFKKKGGGLEIPAIKYEELAQLDSPQAIEDVIEKGFGVELELSVEEEDIDPIDALFGIWKDTDITLEKIREEAWGRNW
ncbi:MAG: hypothetical protein H6577_23460 [Lewinellaceae bacterium]|nr:hypothetical protein [Saprospiraceae bacterium]MCB9341095.1 hypothetical protein [Lewinellaceae bacterium]